MVLIIIGAVLLVIGALILPLAARHQARRAQTFSDVPDYDCAQVAEHGDLAPGMRVSVAGRSAPGGDAPLSAPASGRPCVWYQLTVSERRREVDRDSEGRRTTREVERVVSRERSPDPIAVVDETGRVLVEPADAKIDRTTETMNRLDPPPGGGGGGSLSIGPFTVNLGSGDDLVGVRRKEEIIAPDDDLYVLGGAYARDGEGVIRKPREGMFVISTRSADELASGARTGMRWFAGGAGVLALAGVVLVVLGIVL